jgi:hypothetical protein
MRNQKVASTLVASARRRPESNRCKRLCRPLRNHSATSPGAIKRSERRHRIRPSDKIASDGPSAPGSPSSRRRYGRRLLVFFTRRTYDAQLAVDLVAETHARAFDRRRRFAADPPTTTRSPDAALGVTGAAPRKHR